MRVVLVGSYPLPGALGKGGVERVTQVLRTGLARHMSVTMVVPNAAQSLRHSDEHGTVVYLKRPVIPGFLSYWSWASKVALEEIEREAPDVIHVQDVAGFAFAWPSALRSKSAMVFTPHGILDRDLRLSAEVDPLRKLSAPLRAAVLARIERKSRGLYDDVILINRYLLDEMDDLATRALHHIPNPVDEVFLHPDPEPRPPNDEFVLLLAGFITPRKDTLRAIDIVGAMVRAGVKVHLHILGPVADAGYFARCKSTVEAQGLRSAVTFHGSLPPRSVAEWMDRADALLVVSRQEIAPMVVAEANCRGLPVAVPRAFGLPSMVVEGVNGIFLDDGNPEADAGKIAAMRHHPWDRASIRASAVDVYDPKQVVARTMDAYHTALTRAAGRQPRAMAAE